jgi:hypothetical protein
MWTYWYKGGMRHEMRILIKHLQKRSWKHQIYHEPRSIQLICSRLNMQFFNILTSLCVRNCNETKGTLFGAMTHLKQNRYSKSPMQPKRGVFSVYLKYVNYFKSKVNLNSTWIVCLWKKISVTVTVVDFSFFYVNREVFSLN